MTRNIIIAVFTAIIIGLGITFQLFGTTSHEQKESTAPSNEQPVSSPVPSPTETAAPTDQREAGETNDQTGKPGEAPKG